MSEEAPEINLRESIEAAQKFFNQKLQREQDLFDQLFSLDKSACVNLYEELITVAAKRWVSLYGKEALDRCLYYHKLIGSTVLEEDDNSVPYTDLLDNVVERHHLTEVIIPTLERKLEELRGIKFVS